MGFSAGRIGARRNGARTSTTHVFVDPGLLGDLLSHALARAHFRGEAIFQLAVRDRSITPLRYALLELVGANPGLQQVQLAEALKLSRPAVTLVTDFWQARGCLERRPRAADRRSFGIVLTAQGRELLCDLRLRVLAHDRRFAASLDQHERKELERLLKKLGSDRGSITPNR